MLPSLDHDRKKVVLSLVRVAEFCRSTLFWDITQCVVVILYRRFGTTCLSHVQESWRWDRRVVPKRRWEVPLKAAWYLIRTRTSYPAWRKPEIIHLLTVVPASSQKGAERTSLLVKTVGACSQLPAAFYCRRLTLILLTWTIWRAPTNASKWRMGFNSAFKGLNPSTSLWAW